MSHSRISWMGSCLLLLLSGMAASDDWPLWRHDAGRSAETAEALADELHLQWVRVLPSLKPAFENPRLQFDAGYEPVVLGKRLFVGSSRNDSLVALDTDRGRELWRFFAEGPIRTAPAAWRDRVFVGSDDGYLYCLNAVDGSLAWKFRAVPSNRMVLGNGRVISVWPVRGGPVLQDGRIYFAAGVWPFEGVVVYALDAATGSVIWRNDRAGYIHGIHPHGAKAMGGLTPQGYLLIDGDDLIVPCGTAHPASFELASGRLKSFQLPEKGRLPGGWFAALSREQRRGESPPPPLRLTLDRTINTDRHEDKQHTGQGRPDVRGRICVGGREYLFKDGYPGVEGGIHTMLAADGKLFVVTVSGRLYCFGPKPSAVLQHGPEVQSPPPASDESVRRVRRMLQDTRHGYALVLGLSDGQRVEELVRQSSLCVLAVSPDGSLADTLRKRWDRAGWYGDRVAVVSGESVVGGLPAYFAQLIVAERTQRSSVTSDPDSLAALSQCLHPYGGTMCFDSQSLSTDLLQRIGKALEARGLKRTDGEGLVRWTRAGGLAGASNYTTPWQASRDELVRAPLGVLWYDDDLGFFKRAPQPMFVDGVLRAYDKLWMGYPSGDRPPYKLADAPIYQDVYTGRALSADEVDEAERRFPPFDPRQPQPDQYRPVTQRDPWKPEAPSAGERINPLTGKPEPRSFPKSYGCDGGFDYGHLYTMRSGTAAFYDKRRESGTIHISGPRSGCTNSIVPACGVLNFPFYYKGCTCSYPLPTSAALVSMPETYEQWSSWGASSDEKVQGVQRLGVNFGAPGDRVTEAGTLWLDVPSVGGPSPTVDVVVEGESVDYFYNHSLFIRGGQGWPWVAASGVEGLACATIRGFKPGRYTVRLCFAELNEQRAEARVFDVALQGRPFLRDFHVARDSGGTMRSLVKTADEVDIDGSLEIRFTPQAGRPVLCGVEVVAQGLRLDPLPLLPDK